MTVTSVEKDVEKLTMVVTTDLAAGVDRVWQMWADPRLLEKWWGPPTYPATFEKHELSAGGLVTYFMTGPEGNKFHGLWHVTAVHELNFIEIDDAFADDDGNEDPNMPVSKMRVDFGPLEGSEGVTRMTISSTFPSAEAMQQLTEMGMEEGMTLAVGQIDDLL